MPEMREREPSQTVTAEITITNATDSSLHLYLEPWANEHDVPAGGRMNMALAGPDKADLEIEVGPAGLVVYGWVGSMLDDHINPPGPPAPPTPGSSYVP
jgi:hypothetical protein